MSLDRILGHFDVLNGSVDGEDFLDVFFVDIAGQPADVNLDRTRRRRRGPLSAPD